MHLYKSLGILLKDYNKFKNATVVFLRKKHNSVSSFVVVYKIPYCCVLRLAALQAECVAREQRYLASKFCRDGSKVILNDSAFNFGRYTSN